MEMTKITICQQNDLDSDLLKNEFNEDYPCHIYFICRRPRVMIVPEKCYFKGELMNLTFAIQKQFGKTGSNLLTRPPPNKSFH